MPGALHCLCFTVFLCSAAGNANKKQAIISVAGISDIQKEGLLRTARLDAAPTKGVTTPDLDADLAKLITPDDKSKVTNTNSDMPMSLIAKTSGDFKIDGALKKLIDADADSQKSAAAALATGPRPSGAEFGSDHADMKNVMASLSHPLNAKGSVASSLKSVAKGDDAIKAAFNDPDMDKAMAGIDKELKEENDTDITQPRDKDPLKFDSLNKLLGDLKTEQNMTDGDLDKSMKDFGHLNDDGKANMEQVSKDLEQSLADLNETSLPNAASLLELEVDDGTNHRMSMMLHNMGKTGAQIKHLTQRINELHSLHRASQLGDLSSFRRQNHAILSHVEDEVGKDSRELADSKKVLDKELADVQKEGDSEKVLSGSKSLTQGSSAESSRDMAWVDDMLTKRGGAQKIDHEADRKTIDKLLAEYEAMYPGIARGV